MKLTVLFLVIGLLNVQARGISQNIHLTGRNIPLEKVFSDIEKQTGFVAFYKKGILNNTKNVSFNADNMPLPAFLDMILKGQPLQFRIGEKTIILSDKITPAKEFTDRKPDATEFIPITGHIMDDEGHPLANINVGVKGGSNGTSTDVFGNFSLNAEPGSTLVISSVGFETKEIFLKTGTDRLVFTLVRKVSALDETLIIGYGTTTKRLSTGSVGKVTSSDIEKQPVSDVLGALEGRVPGMLVTQGNGLVGSSFSVQIRGMNSLFQGSQPLYIIDGVPMATGNFINQLYSAMGASLSGYNPENTNPTGNVGASPLLSLNPSDVESIEVLKDADATAIYGSRGANGVILISTKKGKSGKTSFNANVYTGISRVGKLPQLLNTRQYLDVRYEALKNDGLDIDAVNSPDLAIYDTTKYTDLQELFLGGKAKTTDAQLSFSGGNAQTKFLIGGGFHRETTLFPGSLAYNRGSFHANINHTSMDNKLSIQFTGTYAADKNNQAPTDLTPFTYLPPNVPDMLDAAGNLVWYYNGQNFENPFAYLKSRYTAKTDNLSGNLQLQYRLLTGLSFKTSVGYQAINYNEVLTNPLASRNPEFLSATSAGSASFASNSFRSYIIEPQLTYKIKAGPGVLEALAGGSWQYNQQNAWSISAGGYGNDELLSSLAAAATVTSRTSTIENYKYMAVFGRVNYNIRSKYILNLTGRRDGSSRFGPGNQFSSFGAAGAAWIISSEDFMKAVPVISFAKLRASYGTTGNDQIGNYRYLNTWSSTTYPYQGQATLKPTALFNSDYKWETNRKLELAIDLELFKGRLLTTAAWFRNRTSNQLIPYELPGITGFGSILKNFDALIQNQGWELDFTSRNITGKHFSWTTAFNISITRNKLLSFPGLESSAYALQYEVGKPVTSIRAYEYLGVDPATGMYQFNDRSKNGSLGQEDYIYVGDHAPSYYGGLKNSFTYQGLQLDIFFEFKKQLIQSQLAQMIYNGFYQPGSMNNMAVAQLTRWQKAGDLAPNQRYTNDYFSEAGTAGYNLFNSSGAYVNGTYARLKNLSLSYILPDRLLNSAHFSKCRIYLQAQNILTITGYDGDPETMFGSIPPLKTFTVGLQFTIQ